jgi:hypothetical protein
VLALLGAFAAFGLLATIAPAYAQSVRDRVRLAI